MSQLSILGERVRILRRLLEPAFSPETSISYNAQCPSSGHCAAVANIFNKMYGGIFVSTKISSISHWFNRLEIDEWYYDIDLTGDQFNRPAVQIMPADMMYLDTIIRSAKELKPETLERSKLLFSRIGHI